MEFTIEASKLKTEVNLLQGIAEKKSGVTALANVLIESTKDGILLIATDLDTTIQVNLPAEIKTEGAMCISAKKLYDIVRSLDSGTIKFKKQPNEWVLITCNTTKFRVPGLAPSHFPEIAEVTENEVTMDGDALKFLINHTCFAITNEESRFSLGGAKLDINEGSVTLASTDGRRIALATDTIDDVEAKLEVLIPKKALTEVLRFVGNEVVIAQDKNHIKFKSGTRVLIARKLALNFPDCQKAMPKDNDIEVTFSSEDMVKSLKRNAIMADERSLSVKIEVKADQMVLSSNSNGESEEVVKCTVKNLPETSLIFYVNWIYLVEYLSTCTTVSLKLKDATSPAELSEGNSTYILMPMRPV